MSEPERGQWRSYSPLSNAVSASENEHNSLKLDVKEEVATTDIESVALGPVKDLPQVEDISPCDSPLVEIATVQTETIDESNTKSEPKVGNNLYSDIEVNDDDDAMSLSSISSNEESFEVNEPVKKLSPRHKPITVPPPNMVFPHFLPPISVPPPGYFPTNVPPPPLAVPVLPPPLPPPVVLPAVDVTVPPPSLPTSVLPPPLPPAHVPPTIINTSIWFLWQQDCATIFWCFSEIPWSPKSHVRGISAVRLSDKPDSSEENLEGHCHWWGVWHYCPWTRNCAQARCFVVNWLKPQLLGLWMLGGTTKQSLRFVFVMLPQQQQHYSNNIYLNLFAYSRRYLKGRNLQINKCKPPVIAIWGLLETGNLILEAWYWIVKDMASELPASNLANRKLNHIISLNITLVLLNLFHLAQAGLYKFFSKCLTNLLLWTCKIYTGHRLKYTLLQTSCI